MRRIVAVLLVTGVLSACASNQDPLPTDAAPTTSSTPAIPSTSPEPIDDPEPLDECPEVEVEPGGEGIEWQAATTDPWGFTTLTVAVDGGFLISTEECATVVDLDGTRRWSLTTGHVINGVQVGARIVVLTTPTRPDGAIVTAYDAATGLTVWDDTTTVGAWQGLIALDDVVVLVGTGEGPLVTILDSATAEVLGVRTGHANASPVVPLLHDGLVVVGFPDDGDGRLLAIDASGQFVFDRAVRPRYPVPVAASGDLVVLQASGLDDHTGDAEPATFLAAHNLTSGEEAWTVAVAGTHPAPVVQVADAVVVSTSVGVTAVDIATGTVRWMNGTEGEGAALVAPLADDAVAVASGNGVEVLEIGDGTLRWAASSAEATRLLGTPPGHVLVVDSNGRYALLDGQTGHELWSAVGPIPTYRDTPPNHRQMVETDGYFATIGCPADLERCERTDQRVVTIRPRPLLTAPMG